MSDPILDKLDAKLKPRIDALQASEKNVFDNQFDAIRKTYAYLQSRLTAAEKERDTIKMQEAASKVVINCALDDLRKLTGNTNGCLASEIKCVAKRISEAETRVKELEQINLRIREYNANADIKIKLLRAELDKLKGTE